jgi:hypothetical protein
VAYQRHREFDDALGQPALVHDLAGQQEERHGQQRVVVGAAQQVLRQDLGLEHVHVPHQRHTADQQRHRDGNADRHREHQRAKENRECHGGRSG